MRNRGLAFKLIVLALGASGTTFLLLLAYGNHFTRSIVLKYVGENAAILARDTVARLDAVLASAESVPAGLATVIETTRPSPADLFGLLRASVEKNPRVYGSCAAFEPRSFSPDAEYYAPYFFRNGDGIDFLQLGGESYPYFHLDWYQIPKELDRPVWSEPFFDKGGGGTLMTTHSVPVHRDVPGQGREFLGVVTADVSLDALRKTVDEVKILRTGFAFLVSRAGMFIIHPDPSFPTNETIFSLAEIKGDPALRRIGRDMIAGGSGFVRSGSILEGRSAFVHYAPLARNGWSFGVVYPEDELFADLSWLARMSVLLAGGGLLIMGLLLYWIARSVTRPIRALARAAEQMSAGELDAGRGEITSTMRLVVSPRSAAEGTMDAALPAVRSGDEVGKLAQAFISMQSSLKEYIRDLKETTAAKERIESELMIAREIQMSILPKIFPPFPHRREFDLHAEIAPAREVGGDFYDFHMAGPDKIWMAIGDVSGKGVPASLYMAITRTLLRVTAENLAEPGPILGALNRKLCEDNDSGMFVTLFLAVLDIPSGRLQYANGGHNPPVLSRREGSLEWVGGGRGRALGVLEDSEYAMDEFVLRPGDSLFLYTDGVTEAMNWRDELFDTDRLLQALDGSPRRDPKEQVKTVLRAVREFAIDAAQSDDITALALKYYGSA